MHDSVNHQRSEGVHLLSTRRASLVLRVEKGETLNDTVLRGIANLMLLVVDPPETSYGDLVRQFPYLAMLGEECVSPLKPTK